MRVEATARVDVGPPVAEDLRVTARLGDDEIFFSASDGPVAAAPEAWTAVALLPAMVLGAELRVAGALSPRFLAALPRIQALFHGWEDWYRLVRVGATSEGASQGPAGTRVGCFFSGGLDSLYTVLRRPDIDELIFVHGFDVALENRELRDRVAGALRQAAAELGKPLVEVETNVRDFTDRHVDWGWCHLAAQAAVAYVLAPRFSRIYVSSTHPDAYYSTGSAASGSHPLLPPLWSTERTKLVQDGRHAGRVAKAAAIASSEVALKTLRVCWWNPDGAYNCGRCEKCLLTMVNLCTVGALERCETLPRHVEPWRVARLPMTTPSTRFFMTENLRALEESKRDPELAAAVRTCLEGA